MRDFAPPYLAGVMSLEQSSLFDHVRLGTVIYCIYACIDGGTGQEHDVVEVGTDQGHDVIDGGTDQGHDVI